MSEPQCFFGEGSAPLDRAFFLRTPRLISLDFDGTLSEIAPTPASAYMPEKTRILLGKLARLPETKVVILSGRSVPDVKAKVRVPGLLYIGNHGLDFSPPSAGWGIPALSGWIRETQPARERLEKLVRRWPGALLETKGPDLSLHYRRVEPTLAQRLVPVALAAVHALPVEPRIGKCVLEFRPKGAPGKGQALRRVADRFFLGKTWGTCIHVGDDESDEEAFLALRRMNGQAFGFKVGPEPTQADHRLRGPEEVRQLLEQFLIDR